jgi:excisionase family DNA binding protein
VPRVKLAGKEDIMGSRKRTQTTPQPSEMPVPLVTGTLAPLPVFEAKKLYTVHEAAHLLSLSEQTLYRWLLRADAGRRDGLRSVKVGALRRIPHSALDEFIAAHTRD